MHDQWREVEPGRGKGQTVQRGQVGQWRMIDYVYKNHQYDMNCLKCINFLNITMPKYWFWIIFSVEHLIEDKWKISIRIHWLKWNLIKNLIKPNKHQKYDHFFVYSTLFTHKNYKPQTYNSTFSKLVCPVAPPWNLYQDALSPFLYF